MNTSYKLKSLLYSRRSWNFNFKSSVLLFYVSQLQKQHCVTASKLPLLLCVQVMHSFVSLIYLLSLPLTLPLISITVSFSECSCIKYTWKASPVYEDVGNQIVSLSIIRVHVYLWMFNWRNSWQPDISVWHSLLLQHHYLYILFSNTIIINIFMLTCISNYYLENIFLS